jgi:hypothetical protein
MHAYMRPGNLRRVVGLRGLLQMMRAGRPKS